MDGWMDGCVFRAVGDVAVVCRVVPFPPFLFLGGVVLYCIAFRSLVRRLSFVCRRLFQLGNVPCSHPSKRWLLLFFTGHGGW